jgi:hypothetical protein
MTDLAPFVASVLRDRVVHELQEEIRQLRVRLAASIGSSRTVSISGVNGEIYAEGHVDEDGHPRVGAEDCWQIDLQPRAIQCSSMEQFRAIEIRIGDLRKSVLESVVPDQRFGYFRRYDPETSQANLSFTMGGASIFATLGPLSQEDFDARPYEYDQAEIFDVFSDVFNKEREPAVTLVFKTFQFANNLYTGWDVRPLVGNKES